MDFLKRVRGINWSWSHTCQFVEFVFYCLECCYLSGMWKTADGVNPDIACIAGSKQHNGNLNLKPLGVQGHIFDRYRYSLKPYCIQECKVSDTLI